MVQLPVKLAVTKLSLPGTLASWLPQAYHTSIFIGDREFWLGDDDVESWPVMRSHRANSSFSYCRHGAETVYVNVALALKPHFKANSYDVVRKNCNHFTYTALTFLDREMPDKYQALERLAFMAPVWLTQMVLPGYIPNPGADDFDMPRVISLLLEAGHGQACPPSQKSRRSRPLPRRQPWNPISHTWSLLTSASETKEPEPCLWRSLDSDLSDDSGTSDSLDVEALLPPSGPTSPENKTSGVPTFAEESKEQTAAAPAAVEPDLALLESSDAASSSLDGESNLDVEALLETSSPELRAAEQRLEESAPIAVGERRGSSSSVQEEHQGVPFAPRGSGFLFDQDPAPARETALPDASAHREIQISEVETQPALHSAMPVAKGSAVVGEATAAPSVEEPIRAASDGSPARGSVAQEVHRLEQVIRSRSTSPAQMVVHQPRLPSVQTQACTPDASPTRRSQARTPDASPTRRAQVKVAEAPVELQPEVLKDRRVPEQPAAADSAQERLKRIEKANAEAEDLWQEQLSVEISCEVARNLGSLKAQPEIFMAQVAELRLRSNLHKAASERYAELLATARAAASSPVSPAKPTDLEDLEESLSKAQRCPEALQQMASDLRTRCREKEAILRVKLDHDARQLRSQIFASIAARAKAEARLAQARAASKSAEAQQVRRAAEASLEMRRHLQDGGSSTLEKGPGATRKAFVPAARKPIKGATSSEFWLGMR
eukprot:s361_g5.t2